MQGWIKIHRQLLNWEWFDNSKMVHLFLYFLLKANTEKREWRGLTIDRGQLITSVPVITAATGLSEQEIRTCVKRLIKANQIVYNTTHRATHRIVVVTVCNYEKYQEQEEKSNEPNNEQPTNQQRTPNEPATDKQRVNKNNKNKRIKEDIEIEGGTPPSPLGAEAPKAPEPSKEEKKPQEKPKEKKQTDYDKIKDLWNTLCPSFAKVLVISKSRHGKIKQRIQEMGGIEKALPMIEKIFIETEKSDFLRGDTPRGWKASFDWIFENDKNWVKVWEGNYENKPKETYPTTTQNRNYNGTTTKHSTTADSYEARQQWLKDFVEDRLNNPRQEPDIEGNY